MCPFALMSSDGLGEFKNEGGGSKLRAPVLSPPEDDDRVCQ